MSLYVINCEYDLDTTLKECVKLISTKEKAKVRVAFQNMGMVKIFLNNLSDVCEALEIDPEESDFSLDVFVGSPINDISSDDDEGGLEFNGSH